MLFTGAFLGQVIRLASEGWFLMAINDVKELLRQLNKELEDLAPDVLSEFPLETYRELLVKRNKFTGYRDPGIEVRNLCKAIKERGGNELLCRYHRNLLIYLIAVNGDDAQRTHFPELIQVQYREEFKRIVSELETNPSEWYSWDEDLFCKDLAICCFRMFPAGCLKTEMHAGIPRIMFMKVKPSEMIRFTALMMRLGGFNPYFEIHLDVRYKADLNPEGWDYALRLVGQMLDLFPEVKGITGASWFFDPQMRTISPRLSYLRQHIEEAGGKFFFAGRNDHVIELATSASATRRNLYENGTYLPASYMTIWPREKVLEWLN